MNKEWSKTAIRYNYHYYFHRVFFCCFNRIHTEASGKHVDNFTGVFTERDEMLP